MDFASSFNSNEVNNMDKENMIELLEDFIDFLKEKEDEKKEEKVVEVIEDKDEVYDDDDDDTFVKTIDKISKGE